MKQPLYQPYAHGDVGGGTGGYGSSAKLSTGNIDLMLFLR
jgi:hypothetical protein